MMDGQGTQTQGAQASSGGGGWASDLQKLAGHTEAAEQQNSGGASLDDVKGLLGGSSSGGGLNSSALDGLLGHFEQSSGKQFTGSDTDFKMLTNLANQETGSNISETVMRKLMMWKMKQMF